MVYKIKWTNKFKKSYKQAQRRGLDISLLKDIIFKLQNNISLEEKHKNHELKGKYSGFKECHIQPDWLLIYYVDDDILTLTLVDTGIHSDLFNI